MLCTVVGDIDVCHSCIPGGVRPHLVVVKAAGKVVRREQYATIEERLRRVDELEQGLRLGRFVLYYGSPTDVAFAEVLNDAGDLVELRVLDVVTDKAQRFWCGKMWLKPWTDRPQDWHREYEEADRLFQRLVVPAFILLERR